MTAGVRLAAKQRDARIAEARRVMDLAIRHQLCFEFTADGWRMRDDVDVDELPPAADGEALSVAS